MQYSNAIHLPTGGTEMLKFDPTITLGNLVQVGLLIVAIVGGIVRFARLEQKTETVWKWFERNIIENQMPAPKVKKPNGRYPLGLN